MCCTLQTSDCAYQGSQSAPASAPVRIEEIFMNDKGSIGAIHIEDWGLQLATSSLVKPRLLWEMGAKDAANFPLC